MNINRTLFSPSEVQSITGIGVDLLRDHRRRGFIKKPKGHAKFDLFECLQLAFVTDAAALKIGPQISYPTAEWIAHSALYFALQVDEVIKDKYRKIEKQMTAPDPTEAEVRDYIAKRAFTACFERPRVPPAQIGALWEGGEDYFGPSIEPVIHSIKKTDKRHGKPFLVLDLKAFGQRIALNLPRPACVVMK